MDDISPQAHSLGSDQPPVPSPREELEAFLQSDPTRLGDVYRGLKAGKDADEIARDLDVQTSNFVWNYSRIIDALLDRNLPTAPVVARQVASRYRAMLKKQQWSQTVGERLAADLAVVEAVATDAEAQAEEAIAAQKQTKAVEERGKVGIYAYGLPHYLRYPYDPDTQRTLLKVGHSDRDVMQRMQAQTRTTALPEEPVLLRVYPTEEHASADIESKFHKTLRALITAGQPREWRDVSGF